MWHYWYLFGIKLPPNLELTSNSPYSTVCFKWYLTWPFFRLLLWNTRSKTYIKFLGKKSLIFNWLPRYIPVWLYRQFQHSPKKIYLYSLSLRSAEQKNISVSIGNHMIWNHLITYTFFSSAIWNKQARVNFSKTNKSARAGRASALCGAQSHTLCGAQSQGVCRLSHTVQSLFCKFRCPEIASELARDIFAFFDWFWCIILDGNIECQSILQKTFEQFGLVASKYVRKPRYKSNFQCVSLLRRICLCPVMFLQSAFQFGFYRRNLVFPPWNLAWNSFYIVKNPNLLVSPFNSPPIDQSFSSILRPENCTAVFVCFLSKSSGRNNDTYAFQYTFKNNTTQ